eukprot:8020894-Karenia_brevis.AAC.1
MHAKSVSQHVGIGHTPAFAGPRKSMFRDLLRTFCEGNAIADGFVLPDGRLGKQKATDMLWCISEAHNDNKRQWLRDAATINVIRDERHARLHVRFRCAGPSEHQ